MSGRKNNLKVFHLISAQVLSADFTSGVTNIQFLDNIGIQLNLVGTAVGTFEIQVSADYSQDDQGNVLNAGHWVPITLDPVPAATGVDAQIYLDINQLSAPWIRVFFDSTSGSSVLNGYITAKMI